jgi:hypothetical protein
MEAVMNVDDVHRRIGKRKRLRVGDDEIEVEPETPCPLACLKDDPDCDIRQDHMSSFPGQKLRVDARSSADREDGRARKQVLEADDAAPELLLEKPTVELGSAPGPRDAEVVSRVLVEESDLALLETL